MTRMTMKNGQGIIKMRFCMTIAGLSMEVTCCYKTTRDFCRDYLTTEKPMVAIKVSESNILAEQDGNYPLPYLEIIALLRQIAEILPFYDRLLFHGAVIAYKGKGLMFTAPSGTGKSTHIYLWQRYLGKAVSVINGDKPIVLVKPGGIQVYGTPWAGKEGWQCNTSAQLEILCQLQQGKKNEISELSPVEAVPIFGTQIYLPRSAKAAERTLELMDVLLTQVRLCQLSCNVSEDAVRCSLEGLVGYSYEKERRYNCEN